MSQQSKLCGHCFLSQINEGICGACGTPVPPSALAASIVLPVGTLLDHRYLVGYPLGAPGGFGIAYRCWEDDLRRVVVIKELFPADLVTRYPNSPQVQIMNEGAATHFRTQRDLFLDEARKVAQLEEVDSVVRVLRFFPENNTAYFVMPFVEGEPLSTRVDERGRLSLDAALALFWPLAEGLAGVHRQGILHRDIKPENIIIKKDGQPVLIDFGNAISLNSLLGAPSGGFHAVSPHFSAPEQHGNQRARMGPHTDVYALCGLLYYAVSGQRPTDVKDRNSTADAIVPLRRLVPDLPDIFVQTVERGLSLEESQRPASVEALLDALAPLRPAAFHWIQALPDNPFGARMRSIHQAMQSGRHFPLQWNVQAGIFQWFWLFSQRLPAAATGIAALVLLAAALGMVTRTLWLALFMGVIITGVLCAAFSDSLLYRRVATLGSSLHGGVGQDGRAMAESLLSRTGRPHPGWMMVGLAVPMLLLGFGVLRESYEKGVREQVALAIALPGLRQQFEEYFQTRGVVPPSLADLGYEFTPDNEIKSAQIVAGDLHLTLALPAVLAHKIILHSQRGDSAGPRIIWACEVTDLPAAFTPDGCQHSH